MFCKCIARRWLVVAGYHNFSSSPSPATNFSPTGVVFTRRKEPKNQIQMTIKNRIWGHFPRHHPIPKVGLNRRKGKKKSKHSRTSKSLNLKTLKSKPYKVRQKEAAKTLSNLNRTHPSFQSHLFLHLLFLFLPK